MGLYDGIKDVAKIVQQADNVDLYKKLLDLSAQALDMQSEIQKLKEENTELKHQKNITSQIERHDLPYLTLKDDDVKLKYCSNCWDNLKKLIQLHCNKENGKFKCPTCNVEGVYDEIKDREYKNHQKELISSMNKPFKRY